MASQITITRDETDQVVEPYVWLDDRPGGEPGWVLRYSLGDEVGQRHLDRPLDVAVDAEDDEIISEAEACLPADAIRNA